MASTLNVSKIEPLTGSGLLKFGSDTANTITIDTSNKIFTIEGTLAANTVIRSGGFSVNAYNIGIVSTAANSVTLNPYNGNYQYYTANAQHTITAPSNDCAIEIMITNGSAAGTIAFSGFTANTNNAGDDYATTSGYKYILSVKKINSTATYVFKALQ